MCDMEKRKKNMAISEKGEEAQFHNTLYITFQ